jgi:hypothetical protein
MTNRYLQVRNLLGKAKHDNHQTSESLPPVAGCSAPLDLCNINIIVAKRLILALSLGFASIPGAW